jgi:hypothetical protein
MKRDKKRRGIEQIPDPCISGFRIMQERLALQAFKIPANIEIKYSISGQTYKGKY